MSKRTRDFIDQVKSGESPSLAQSFPEVGGQIWDAAKPMFDHGRTELAAALFAGHAHVMYMHEANTQNERVQGSNQEQAEVQQDAGRDL
jgi:hypothetical protein